MNYEIIQADLCQDRQAILQLWNNHHDRKLDNKYQWIYEQNPDGKAMVWLVRDTETGEYVGMTSLFPRNILYMNHKQLSTIGGDLFICPSHRSLKAAIMLQRAVLAAVDMGATSSIYTFPNRQAALIMRRVGFKHIDPMVRMVWILRSEEQLQKRGINKFLSKIFSLPIDLYLWRKSFTSARFVKHNLECINLQSFDQRYEGLWDRCKKHFSISLDKNTSYMNWKYISDPDSHSKIFCVIDNSNNKMYGCIVYRQDELSIEIRDLILDENDRVNRFFVYQFLKFIKPLKPDSAYVSVLDNSSMKARLQKLGFMQGSKGRDIFYYNSTHSSTDMSAMSESRNWLLMNCDDDT